MSQAPRARRTAEWLIEAACRRLADDVRADRCREWAAELPAILDDQSIRLSFLRTVRALTFCAGISRTTCQLRRRARAGSRRAQRQAGTVKPPASEVAARAVVAAVVWLVWAWIALTAASKPSGLRTRSTSRAIAASMLRPLTEMHRLAPWLMRAP